MTRRASASSKKDAHGFTLATLEEKLALRSFYSLDPDELSDFNERKDTDLLHHKFGGLEALSHELSTSIRYGLQSSFVENSRGYFGANVSKSRPPKNFFVLVWETIQDPVIILLIAAATVSTIMGLAIPEQRANNGWIEGAAIWVAVFVVVGVGAGNDWQKDRQFQKLHKQRDEINIKVMRDGHQMLVLNTHIVVGDIVLLDTGDKVVADCLVVESFGLVVDESSLTGEAEPIKKDSVHDPWIRSGTQVTEGSGRVLVLAVGEKSEWGKTIRLLDEAGDEQTPLQKTLEVVATAIGKVGAGVAVCCFLALTIKWMIINHGFPLSQINNNGPIQFFLYGITIVVVAVPEGLPLAVTISLAYSMRKMMKDNNFVRVLSACETMGGATAICSDKTGTLTENRMKVVEGWFAGRLVKRTPQLEDVPPSLRSSLVENLVRNNKAYIAEAGSGSMTLTGNRTECALLLLAKKWGVNFQVMRDQLDGRLHRMFGFSSVKKMSSCVILTDNGYKVYNKGAAEWVLDRCVSVYNGDGELVPMTSARRADLLQVVEDMASRGLRCICVAESDLPLHDPARPPDYFDNVDQVDSRLTALAILGIKDPVRPEVPAAVATCQRAGIIVRMVTGDNIHTARHIATECGILYEGDHLCMEGPEFRAMNRRDLIFMLPNIRVLARSSPADKLELVRLLKEQGEVVAVTGDGTNDAPALKESDVGLAMGIAGTEVAKEAADIIILDDNFSSIVKTVLWGRAVFNNIRKFLQFQLTVNFVALVTAFVGAVAGGHEPLNVLQLLWVNIIMDSMGALALATEDPAPELLNDKPHGRDEPLITRCMWKHILVQGLYQLFWMMVCLYALPSMVGRYHIRSPQEFYAQECLNVLQPLSHSNTTEQLHCNWMNSCGLPFGNSSSLSCQLFSSYWQGHGGLVPDNDIQLAICHSANTTCEDYTSFLSSQRWMSSAQEKDEAREAMQSLSFLFNAFIMMQVANEINSRRINDELTIFNGIHHSPIFMSVMVITLGFQALIMCTPFGVFFKVVPLTWTEWLITTAIGFGSIPVSLLTRVASNIIYHRRYRLIPSNMQLVSIQS
ncbi:hypothetical protein CEUSTIGMA_g1405.t1 [Chlamydomonas eustigma]|uniref:Calcium-transporting ATPase n=1 Tax=Chlamydomonas eustigma TaxID=1157962 RepID=A0A250WT05_9CHLO|nr:hypothetical protein CEUSTIGMA_g1405.t1 [Chlamydomonas eustigma]|eukprot:GAX73955.1 hypothetical protein CEUSTIGMA_g1405.t1 [Chlamydomonas eustigma]